MSTSSPFISGPIKKKIGVLGASGYTGADAVRLLARHPGVKISALTANTHAGKVIAKMFPHLFMLDLPVLAEWEKVDWTTLDAVFADCRTARRRDHRSRAEGQSRDQYPGYVRGFPPA